MTFNEWFVLHSGCYPSMLRVMEGLSNSSEPGHDRSFLLVELVVLPIVEQKI